LLELTNMFLFLTFCIWFCSSNSFFSILPTILRVCQRKKLGVDSQF
jgi:hypothetical protein